MCPRPPRDVLHRAEPSREPAWAAAAGWASSMRSSIGCVSAWWSAAPPSRPLSIWTRSVNVFQVGVGENLQRTKAAKAVGTYPPPENDSPDRPYRALTTKSHLARAEPASEPLQLSTSRTRAGLELSRSVPGPRPSPHLSVRSVTHRRMILRINHLFPLCHPKVPPCTGLARAQAAHSELEPNQNRARAEPVQARAEACPTSQCLVCATKFCRRMILRIIQGRALITKTHLAWATLHGRSLHHSRSSTPTSRAPSYVCSASSSCRGTNAVDAAPPPGRPFPSRCTKRVPQTTTSRGRVPKKIFQATNTPL